MMLWQATPASLWQGRDDSAEAPNALRLFQTIARAERFAPQGDARRYQRCSASPVTKGSGVTEAYRGSGRPGDPAPGVGQYGQPSGS